MEASIFQKRIKEAKEKKEKIKLIFQYPASPRATIKRGYVIESFEDGFDFQEIMDGLVTYSYRFLVEIKIEDQNA